MPHSLALSPADIEQFVEEGYTILRRAVEPKKFEKVLDWVWEQTGCKKDDPATWTKSRIHVQKTLTSPEVDEIWRSPRLIEAIDQLLTAGRWHAPNFLGWWPVLFPGFDAPPWKPPVAGWHVDGQQFHHHVNSKDQGILPIFVATDIAPGGGGTAILPGSHKHVARLLASAVPHGIAYSTLNATLQPYVQSRINDVIEARANKGDVILTHPFMLHAVSPNTGPSVRIICNPCTSLHEPMNFDRADGNYSVLERSILQFAGDLLHAQSPVN